MVHLENKPIQERTRSRNDKSFHEQQSTNNDRELKPILTVFQSLHFFLDIAPQLCYVVSNINEVKHETEVYRDWR